MATKCGRLLSFSRPEALLLFSVLGSDIFQDKVFRRAQDRLLRSAQPSMLSRLGLRLCELWLQRIQTAHRSVFLSRAHFPASRLSRNQAKGTPLELSATLSALLPAKHSTLAQRYRSNSLNSEFPHGTSARCVCPSRDIPGSRRPSKPQRAAWTENMKIAKLTACTYGAICSASSALMRANMKAATPATESAAGRTAARTDASGPEKPVNRPTVKPSAAAAPPELIRIDSDRTGTGIL